MGIPLSRRDTLQAAVATGAGVLAGIVAYPHLPERKRKNVTLIVADAMRADAIGKTIAGEEVTPNLNRLAEKGVCFSNAYSTSSHTKISVPSILTGLYPPAHGVESYAHTLPPTLSIQGFFRNCGCRAVGITTNPFLEAESVSPHYGDLDFGFSQRFDSYRLLEPDNSDRRRLTPEERFFAQYTSGDEVNERFRLLSNRLRRYSPREVSFFAFLHYMDSHQPWIAAGPRAELERKFRGANTDLESEMNKDRALVLRLLRDGALEMLAQYEEHLARLRNIYYRACSYCDHYIGRLLALLGSHGASGESIVIVTSDHGEELFEHGRIGHAQNLYEPSIRVPLIFHGEEFGSAKTIDWRVSNAAILPTLMDISGQTHPGAATYSLMPIMEGHAKAHVPLFATLFGLDAGIDSRGYKVIIGKHTTEAFNITRDPQEQSPIEASRAAEASEVCARIRMIANHDAPEKRYSTLRWQNPYYQLQKSRARDQYRKAITHGDLSREERTALLGRLEKRVSRGEFLRRDEVSALENYRIDPETLSQERQWQLRALGYLN